MDHSPSFVESGCLYLVEEARSRLRVGDWAWRKMRRAGLPVIYQGKQAYVLGEDLIEFFRKVRDRDSTS